MENNLNKKKLKVYIKDLHDHDELTPWVVSFLRKAHEEIFAMELSDEEWLEINQKDLISIREHKIPYLDSEITVSEFGTFHEQEFKILLSFCILPKGIFDDKRFVSLEFISEAKEQCDWLVRSGDARLRIINISPSDERKSFYFKAFSNDLMKTKNKIIEVAFEDILGRKMTVADLMDKMTWRTFFVDGKEKTERVAHLYFCTKNKTSSNPSDFVHLITFYTKVEKSEQLVIFDTKAELKCLLDEGLIFPNYDVQV